MLSLITSSNLRYSSRNRFAIPRVSRECWAFDREIVCALHILCLIVNDILDNFIVSLTSLGITVFGGELYHPKQQRQHKQLDDGGANKLGTHRMKYFIHNRNW